MSGEPAPPGPVPRRLDDAVVRRPLIEVAPGRALIRFPGAGRVLVDSGGALTREPDPGRSVEDLEFLADAAASLGHLLAGRFSLWASAVDMGGSGVVLCAPGAGGKSTVAAALAARGHRFVCDAVALVSVDGAVPLVFPRPGGPLLSPGAITQLGLDPDAARPARAGSSLRRVDCEPAGEPVPLGAIVVLRRGDATGAPLRLRGFDAVHALVGAAWHGFAVAPLGLTAVQFAWATALAAAVPVTEVRFSRNDVDPSPVADTVLEIVQGIGTPS